MYQVGAAWGDQRLSVSIVLPRWSHWLGRMGTRHGSWHDRNVTKAHRKQHGDAATSRARRTGISRVRAGRKSAPAVTRKRVTAARNGRPGSIPYGVYPIEKASGGGAEDAARRASGAFIQPGATWVRRLVGLSEHRASPAGHDLQRHIGPGRRPAAAQRRDDHEVVEARRQGARQMEGSGHDPGVVGRDRGAQVSQERQAGPAGRPACATRYRAL